MSSDPFSGRNHGKLEAVLEAEFRILEAELNDTQRHSSEELWSLSVDTFVL
jgi:hypothetical protein